MADYYSILKKTISGLPSNTSANRKIVYGKARQAIDKQLRSLDPMPSEDAIASQMQKLEQAIDRLEGENRAAAVEPAPAAPADKAPAGPGGQPAAQKPAAPHGRPVVTPTGTQPQARPADGSDKGNGAGERPLAGSAPQQRREPAMDNLSPRGEARPAPASRPLAGSSGDLGIPGLEGPARPPAYDDGLDGLGGVDDMIAPEPRRPAARAERRPKRSSRLGSILVTLVVLALIAGGGYALWLNKDTLMAAVGLGGSQPGQEVETGQQPSAAPEKPAGDDTARTTQPADGGKDDVRLNSEGETVAGPAEQPSQPTPNVREAGQPAASQETPPAPPATPQQESPAAQVNPVEEPGAEAASDEAAPAPSAEQDAQTQSEPAELPAIAQKAYLYEEGGTGAGATRDTAAVVWTLDEESPSEGQPPEAVIRGKFDVPGRGLTMDLTIKRNIDDALPASHIIELVFDAPPDFSGGNIDNVARFVMKSSEQARGEGLIAVPAKIDTGYFLIALNNLPQAIETNRKLLVDSTWIDIPIGYTSGKRALVTLEKGAAGDKVFRDAFADWDKR